MSHAINAIVGSKRNLPFLFQVKTDNAGTSASNQFKLPLEASGTYDFTVDWGDTTDDVITVWNQAETTHTYSSAGTYTISITGRCVGWTFNNGGDRLKFLEVFGWGGLRLGNSGGYFFGCNNLVLDAVVDTPILVGTTDFSSLFRDCISLTTVQYIENWNTANVTTLYRCFRGCSLFNDSVNNWNTSSVTSMMQVFQSCTVYNQPLNNWNTSNVTNMDGMFLTASAFNQDITSWDTSSVQKMQFMFQSTPFNQAIGVWNTSSVDNMNGMFQLNTAFNQDITSWDTSNVTNMSRMFRIATAFNQAIGVWDVSSVTNMSSMFEQATAFNQNISNWDISSVTNFENFMLNKSPSNYSAANLDAIYNTWSLLSVQPNINIGFGTIKYTASGTAGRLVLTSPPNNWAITDGGI